ncbi:hypothetical protein AbraCBS73388_004367 [Aspergillus brasiliensis]|uniref:Transcription factor domain-containing protein n=1 Tax=Aspergillus brasiliensis TaxID=319629 RepID=A0A9W5YKA3_9EURO|nr:hypothetical protein AbraCBS73388_004367 [Aspergillus brasiliensis]
MHQTIVPHHSPQGPDLFPTAAQQNLSGSAERQPISADLVEDYNLLNILNLLGPFSGIRNLDLGSSEVPNQVTVPSVESNAYGPIEAVQTSYLRTYASEEDISSAYYIHIHPFLSILQPPLSNQITDRPVAVEMPNLGPDNMERSSLPHWPASALTLAISAILALLPLAQDSNPFSESSIYSRRSYAHLFAEAAFSEVEKEMDNIFRISSHISDGISSSSLSRLSPVLALVLLSFYEYCQRGNVSRMRSRANQAVTAAMDLGLHSLGPSATEAQRRAWWSVMVVLYLSSVDQQVSPVITLDDPRITTPYPSFRVTSDPWPLLLHAEKAIISVWGTMNDRETNPSLTVVPSNISEKILQLDSEICTVMRQLDCSPQVGPRTGPDAHATRTMWTIARILIHMARVRLHRYRAFMDIPLFLDKHCDIAAIQDNRELAQFRLQPSFESAFPFAEQQSSLICLKSALALARAFESLASPGSKYPIGSVLATQATNSPATTHIVPYFACGAMQGSYVLLMIHYQLDAALLSNQVSSYRHLLHRPEPTSEVQDAERLLRELRQGVESILGSMTSANMFEGVSGMRQEIQAVYHAAFLENT